MIFIEHFGLSPSAYSMIFASNAIAFIGSAQFNSVFMRRFGAERVVDRDLGLRHAGGPAVRAHDPRGR